MRKILVIIIILLVSASYYWWIFRIDDNLKLIFIDVGQGDAILIITPDKKTMLIDGGKDTKALNYLVNNDFFLFNRRIDYVLVTHADSDHIGGLDEVVNSFTIDTFMMPNSRKQTKGYQSLLNLSNDNIPNIISISDNSDFVLGCCVQIDFIWPVLDSPLLDYQEENSISASFVLIYKDFSALFSGDLPGEIESYLMSERPIDLDLLKVAHHGSKTSSYQNFLLIIQPEIAVISVGKNNSYHHPDLAVTNRLKALNAKVLRTDELGTIKIVTNGFALNY